jgi:hypothetical protein
MKSVAQNIRRTAPPGDITTRVDAIDWNQATSDLDAQGCAVLKGLLSAEECRALSALYPDDAHFRSRVVMGRHGFGRGEYKYFSYPLPALIGELRPALYAQLHGTANRWNEGRVSISVTPKAMKRFSADAMPPARSGRRRCCCNMAPATTTACIRISTANMCSRCRLRSCCQSPGVTSPAANSC